MEFIFIRTPEEVQKAISPYLTAWSPIIPGWCREIIVVWNDNDTEGALSMRANYEYRRGELTIHPNFISHPERREQAVVHEFIHVLLEPFSNTLTDIKDALLKERPDLKTWVEEQIRYSEESTVCDIAHAMEEAHSNIWSPANAAKTLLRPREESAAE